MNNQALEQIWNDVCEQVKSYSGIDPTQINAFFSRLQPQAASDGFLMLTADNDFIKTWIERHYLEFIKQALLDTRGIPFTVLLEVDAGQEARREAAAAPSATASCAASAAEAQSFGGATAASMTATPAVPVTASNAATPPSAGQTTANLATHTSQAMGGQQAPATTTGSAPAGSPEENPAAEIDDGANSSFTFENFVIGDSNRMAYSMAVSVAERPGKSALNPLFIYGKSGLGKTHLMRAIQNYIKETMPHLRTIYVDSAELLSDYMEASAAHDKEKSSYKNFKTRYEEADVLLIDDVQYLQGKKQTLDIVFQIFNKLTSMGKQVVLSADRAPKNIDIDERYKSRFNQGGTFDIQPPEIETKLGIVKSFVEEYKANEGMTSFSLPNDIQMYIAENASSNIRELKSAVTKVIYQMTFLNQPDLDIDGVRALLENHFSGGPSKRLNVADIQKEVETFYKVSHADIVGKKRTRNIMHARQIAIYLCRQMLDLPFADIGKRFNRDHSTVMYSVTNVEEKMKENRELREEIEALSQIIREI